MAGVFESSFLSTVGDDVGKAIPSYYQGLTQGEDIAAKRRLMDARGEWQRAHAAGYKKASSSALTALDNIYQLYEQYGGDATKMLQDPRYMPNVYALKAPSYTQGYLHNQLDPIGYANYQHLIQKPQYDRIAEKEALAKLAIEKLGVTVEQARELAEIAVNKELDVNQIKHDRYMRETQDRGARQQQDYEHKGRVNQLTEDALRLKNEMYKKFWDTKNQAAQNKSESNKRVEVLYNEQFRKLQNMLELGIEPPDNEIALLETFRQAMLKTRFFPLPPDSPGIASTDPGQAPFVYPGKPPQDTYEGGFLGFGAKKVPAEQPPAPPQFNWTLQQPGSVAPPQGAPNAAPPRPQGQPPDQVTPPSQQQVPLQPTRATPASPPSAKPGSSPEGYDFGNPEYTSAYKRAFELIKKKGPKHTLDFVNSAYDLHPVKKRAIQDALNWWVQFGDPSEKVTEAELTDKSTTEE